MRSLPRLAVPMLVSLLAFLAMPAFAQDSMPGMDMPHTQPSKQMAAKKRQAQPAKPPPARSGNDGADSMPDMDMPGMSPSPPPTPTARHAARADATPMPMAAGAAPAGPRSADYSDGIGYGSMGHQAMDDNQPLGMVLFDRFECGAGREQDGGAFDAQAWFGNDADKLWLKAEGETESGRLQNARLEVLWDRPHSAFWDTQLGVRHDVGIGPDRNWAAVGVQGLAPYWFEVAATLYVGQSGRTAFRFEAEYELLLTQRLILQPRFEANLYGRADPARGIGAGFSDAALGVRLRYEFSRQFAPYVGVAFERKLARTASLARAAGEPAFDPRLVAGLRFWF